MTTDADPEVLAALDLDASGGRRWHPWRWVAGGVVLLLAAGGLALSMGRTPSPESRYELVPVEVGSLEVSVSASGKLAALHEVEVSSELSGIVAEVLVDDDEQVEAGQILATLDTRLLADQLRQARAQVASAKASLTQARVAEEQARLDFERTSQLQGSGAVSAAQLDSARLAHASAVAGVQVAEAQLQSARASAEVAATNLEKAVLRAPTSGVVLERNVDPGQAVVSAMSAPVLFRVAEDLHRMSLLVDIDEADIGRVHPGQQATFTVAAWPDATFDATVHTVRLAPRAASDVVVYEAELDVDNSEELLRPGMTATALLVAERYDDVLKVPSAALRFDPDDAQDPPSTPHVWALDGEGELSAIEVTPGPTDGAWTAVEGALDAGARVAIGDRVPAG